ncbi:MAG: prepilin-type N-terminal cleavage/methylation domain-containing protein [Candidatus Eremiobacteraeota bacterium]|nr:prepilin-type N-terminal cleavage/methylation domain-containing protein [Candidatus Eremiobacteraeota bacterium]
MNTRGFSLAELLISMAIILVLLIAVCGAIVQTLHLQAFHVGRAGMGRTVAEVSERLGEEARSATAVFIPSTDIMGEPNGSVGGAHEVDFFRRLSAGGDAFVAYRFEASSGDVTRYEYSWIGSTRHVTNADIAAGDLALFHFEREPVTGVGVVAGTSDPPAVSILYGRPELAGGNDVIVASIQPRNRDGIPAQITRVHLAARIAPTAVAVLAPKGAPSTPPPTRIFPFVILRPGFPVALPHGPIHGGSLGGSPLLEHWIAAAGSAQFLGPSSDVGNWFEFSALYARIDSGIFTFRNATGSSITAVISCRDGPCPTFRPLPVSAPGITPSGSVAFQLTP